MTFDQTQAGFNFKGGTAMTSKAELLSVKTAIDTMSKTLESLVSIKRIAMQNDKDLTQLLDFIDKNLIKNIHIQYITETNSISINLEQKDALVVEKINSLIAEVLAKRIADAMEEVRKLAPQLSV